MWFGNLGNIDEVHVYGHSIEDVDIPYFKEVGKCADQNARWKFFYYDEDMMGHYMDVAKQLRLNNDRFEMVEV